MKRRSDPTNDVRRETGEGPLLLRLASGTLEGNLGLPTGARGIVLFAHGSGSSRWSPRNRTVARSLRREGFATLLFDLLTPEEEEVDSHTMEYRFDVDLLAGRLAGATILLGSRKETAGLAVGYFGTSTGAAAALIAAAQLPNEVRAVVSRGGRPDLAVQSLSKVRAPTLLIVGGRDKGVLRLNEKAMKHLRTPKKLEIVPGATHLFEEPGALEAVIHLAKEWFRQYLAP